MQRLTWQVWDGAFEAAEYADTAAAGLRTTRENQESTELWLRWDSSGAECGESSVLSVL